MFVHYIIYYQLLRLTVKKRKIYVTYLHCTVMLHIHIKCIAYYFFDFIIFEFFKYFQFVLFLIIYFAREISTLLNP